MVAGQVVLGMSAMLLVAFAPPAQGRMLLLSLNGEPISEPMIRAFHATPLKPGPLQGSWIVDGERASLAGLLSSNGIMVLAAPAALCASSVPNGNNSP